MISTESNVSAKRAAGASFEVPDDTLDIKNPIPPQYRGIPSEVLEELLKNRTIYVDSAKNASEQQRIQEILAAARQQEIRREQKKRGLVNESYARLPEAQRAEFPAAQREATNLIRDYILGKGTVGDLSPEEQGLLNTLKDAWENIPDDQKGKFFNFSEHFTGHVDGKIYENLANRLALDILKAKSKVNDEQKLADVRGSLGIKTEVDTGRPAEAELEGRKDKAALEKLKEFFDGKIAGAAAKPEVQKVYLELYQGIEKSGDNKRTADVLIDFIYDRYRHADYPINEGYTEAWNLATTDKSLNTTEQNGWIYRGVFPSKSKDQKTETRGSLNINVTPEAVKALDELIRSGVIKANYKFGDPGMPSSADSRHDAITIYFLEQPSEAALGALSEISQKHFRGNELLGKKITEGFYMSEVGSISGLQVEQLVGQLEKIDGRLAAAIKLKHQDKKGRLAMSEAQYYAARDALKLFGIDISFDEKTGFTAIS